MNIGEALKRIRLIYGYKANDMSRELEISPSYLSEIEHGNRKPSLEILQNYAEIFDIKVSALLILSEEYTEMKNENRAELFIQKKMIRLIDRLSKDFLDEIEDGELEKL